VSRIALVLGGVFLAAQIARAAILNWTTPELTRGGTPFIVDPGPKGSLFSQTFDIRSGGLQAIRFEAETGAGEPASGAVDARLLVVNADGSEWPLRVGRIETTTAEDCCVFRFSRLPDSARRRYRLDLQVAGGEAGGGPALRLAPATDVGGLAINGQPQPANLLLTADGAELAPLRGARRVALSGVMVAFALFDGTLLYLVYGLVTASDRQPS
jgi:hypothetical protein